MTQTAASMATQLAGNSLWLPPRAAMAALLPTANWYELSSSGSVKNSPYMLCSAFLIPFSVFDLYKLSLV